MTENKLKELEELKNKIFSSNQVNSEELQNLLQHRKDGKINFKLIDIRELYEYTDNSIEGVDFLFPTSMLQEHINDLNRLNDEYMIFYCRTGSRTRQVLGILKRMGFKNIAHLSSGIVSYSGQKRKNAKIPDNIKTT